MFIKLWLLNREEQSSTEKAVLQKFYLDPFEHVNQHITTHVHDWRSIAHKKVCKKLSSWLLLLLLLLCSCHC